MNAIDTKLDKLVKDREQLQRLLSLEKERRGLPQDALAFLSIANVANHWWCTQQSVFKSRNIELDVFAAYLFDRILYAHRLGLATKWPKSDRALLDIGCGITWEDVERLFNERVDKAADRAKHMAGVRMSWLYRDNVDKDGKRSRLINPDLPPGEKQIWTELAAMEGVQVIDLMANPLLRGKVYEALRAEKYSSIRWHFPWSRYTVGGVPDGLTTNFAYEYKTTRNRFLFNFMKPVAFAQADLYGYFFRRPKKRVQIHVIEENVTKTYEEAVDAAQAENTLTAFAQVDAGEPARPPRAWKCGKCNFRLTCPIRQVK
jgi:hypothetical protein